MTGDRTEHINLMNSEWDAWRESGEELQKAGFVAGWNDRKIADFHKAIVLWGERLVALRVPQTSEMRQSALQDAITNRNKPT